MRYLGRLILIVFIVMLFFGGCTIANSSSPIASNKNIEPSSSISLPPSPSALPSVLPIEQKSTGDEYFQFYNGKVFYTDNKYLYVMDESGADGKRIAQLYNDTDDPLADVWRNIHIYNDKIYYVNVSETTIYSMDLDGLNKTVLCDNADEIKDIAESHILYYGSESDSYALFTTDLNGQNKKVIDEVGDGTECIIKDGWVYYTSMQSDQGMKRCHIDGSGQQNYIDDSVYGFIFDNNKVFYSTINDIYCMDMGTGEKTLLANINDPELSKMFKKAFKYKEPYPKFVQQSLGVEEVKDGYLYFSWTFWANEWSGCDMLFKKKLGEATPSELVTSLDHGKGNIFDIDWNNGRIYYYAAYNKPHWASLPKEWGVKRTRPLFYRIDFDGKNYLRINEKDMNQFVCSTFGDYTYFTAWDKTKLYLYRFNNITDKTEKLKSEPVYLGESEGE